MFLASGGPKTKSYNGLAPRSHHDDYGNSFFPIGEIR